MLLLASIILLVLNLIHDGSIYAVLSNILLMIWMVFELVRLRKKKK